MAAPQAMTDLMTNAYYGNLEDVQHLLTQTVDVMTTDSQDLSALFYAVMGGHANIMSNFLNHERAQKMLDSSAPGKLKFNFVFIL